MSTDSASQEGRRTAAARGGAGPRRESAAFFHALMENSLDPVTVLDASGTIVYESPSVRLVLGYEPSELVGRTVYELVHPDDAELVRRAMGAAVRNLDHARRVVLRLRHADGSWRWLEAIGKSHLDNEAVRGVVVNIRDVTQRLRAEEELRESEARFRQLAESVRELFWMVTPDFGQVLYVSGAYERLFGRSAETLRAEPRSFLDSIHAGDRAGVEAWMERLREEPSSHLFRVVSGRGNVHWLETQGFPIRDERGEVYRVAGVTEDVTGRREAEEALRGAKEAAERANLAKSEFLSRMSHELRTPLHAILGFAQLLEVEGPKDRESLAQILHAGNHLLELINEVLDIAGIEAGRVPLSLEPVHAREVLDEALALMGPLAAERGVSFPERPQQLSELYLRADRQRLKQVLLNLLSNAVKYNRPGGEVWVECRAAGADRLRISVHDTGPGIAPERRGELFLPFGRLEADGGEGTGLGLVLARALTEAMGGSVGLESEVGSGSTFWLELALAEEQSERFEHRTAAPPPPRDGRSGRRVVLHVEDNAINLRLFERVLESRPAVQLMQAMQGRLALDLALRHRPDLIVLDLHLPDIPGEEVLRGLRARSETEEIPVLVLTADAMPAQLERMRRAGALACLTKPVNVARLLDVLDGVLEEEAR